MRYKAVVFDLMDTLVSNCSEEEFEQSRRDMAAILSLPFEKFQDLWQATSDRRNVGTDPTLKAHLAYLCSELGFAGSPEKLAEAALLRSELERSNFAAPGERTVETLTKLKEIGYKIAVVSNCYQHIPALFRGSPLAGLVDEAILSCEVGLKKPDARLYQLACERLGVKPEECLYVGDGESDELRGAAAVGMTPVLLKSPLSNQSIARPGIDGWTGLAVTELREILPLLYNDTTRNA
jgi:putative hydrolase of the HAD superfamily